MSTQHETTDGRLTEHQQMWLDGLDEMHAFFTEHPDAIPFGELSCGRSYTTRGEMIAAAKQFGGDWQVASTDGYFQLERRLGIHRYRVHAARPRVDVIAGDAALLDALKAPVVQLPVSDDDLAAAAGLHGSIQADF